MAVLRGNLFSKVPDRTMTISNTPMMSAPIVKVMAGGGSMRGPQG